MGDDRRDKFVPKHATPPVLRSPRAATKADPPLRGEAIPNVIEHEYSRPEEPPLERLERYSTETVLRARSNSAQLDIVSKQQAEQSAFFQRMFELNEIARYEREKADAARFDTMTAAMHKMAEATSARHHEVAMTSTTTTTKVVEGTHGLRLYQSKSFQIIMVALISMIGTAIGVLAKTGNL